MPAYSAQETLEVAVQACLDNHVPEDVDVVWHLCNRYVQSTQETEGAEPVAVLEFVWFLHLTIVPDRNEDEEPERIILLEGALPYHLCSDGDVGPLLDMLHERWAQFESGEILPKDMDAELARITMEGFPEP
jgi:hypothetical protein